MYAWWKEATPERRALFLKAIKDKQLDVNSLTFSIIPYNNAKQNEVMANWISNELAIQFNQRFELMNDVNGISRSLASSLLDKGINYIWLSINYDWGGAPFKQPNAFWWKMPHGRKTLVWSNLPYREGYNIFNKRHCIRKSQQSFNKLEFIFQALNTI